MSVTVTQLPTPEPRSHVPSGRPSWPRILLSGEEGARKSWTAAELSADERLGGMFWLEVGSDESTAEEYGAIPRANYRVIDHDGTYAEILGQLRAHKQLAQHAEDAGEPPIALALDSFTGVWAMLTTWGDLMARRREAERASKYKKPIRPDLWSPDFVPQITPDLWNLVNRRWAMIVQELQSWPGPVVYTAREKLVTVIKDNGQPDADAPKIWTLEAQKGLGFASSAWVRMTRDAKPAVVKLRSVREGNIRIMRDAGDGPAEWSGKKLSLAELIFDVIGCEAGVSRAPEVRTPDADQVLPGEQIEPTSPQDEPPRRATAQRSADEAAKKGVAALVTVGDPAKAEELVGVAEQSAARSVNIIDKIDEAARVELKINENERVSLVDLAKKVADYVKRHEYSVAQGVKVAEAEASDRSDSTEKPAA